MNSGDSAEHADALEPSPRMPQGRLSFVSLSDRFRGLAGLVTGRPAMLEA